jgi:hypothetical protein
LLGRWSFTIAIGSTGSHGTIDSEQSARQASGDGRFLVTMDRAGRDRHGCRGRYRLNRDGMAEVTTRRCFFFARDHTRKW